MGETTAKLYVVIQEPQIKAWCWGSCGQGLNGAIDLGVMAGIPCRFSPCPHLEKEYDTPLGDVSGEPVYLRKLKPLDGRTHEETPG